jgi:hypothetical protein
MTKQKPQFDAWGNLHRGASRPQTRKPPDVDDLIRDSRSYTQMAFSDWANEARLVSEAILKRVKGQA